MASSNPRHRTAGLATLVLGACSVLFVAADWAFGADFSPTLRYANLAGGVLLFGVGVAMMKGGRAPWAFATITTASLAFVDLFAWPAILGGASDAALSAVISSAHWVLWGSLVYLGREFRSIS